MQRYIEFSSIINHLQAQVFVLSFVCTLNYVRNLLYKHPDGVEEVPRSIHFFEVLMCHLDQTIVSADCNVHNI